MSFLISSNKLYPNLVRISFQLSIISELYVLIILYSSLLNL